MDVNTEETQQIQKQIQGSRGLTLVCSPKLSFWVDVSERRHLAWLSGVVKRSESEATEFWKTVDKGAESVEKTAYWQATAE